MLENFDLMPGQVLNMITLPGLNPCQVYLFLRCAVFSRVKTHSIEMDASVTSDLQVVDSLGWIGLLINRHLIVFRARG